MNSQSNLSPGESLDFLRLLSKQFPSIQSVCTEIINLEAILDLPKGTEHFISDLHGEYEAVLYGPEAQRFLLEHLTEIFGRK